MAEIHAKKIDEKKFANLLQQDLLIEGQLHFPHSVLIKGEIQGSLHSKSQVLIGKTASVRGDIQASCLQIRGQITGDIHCTQDVKMEQGSRVCGDISSPNLHIEPGSFFEGHSIMNLKEE